MNIFAYHSGNNGVSHYRIWQPVKYLNRIEGFNVQRLPNITERLQIPLEGQTNVPGVPSHGDIFRNNDVVWDVYRADFDNSMRFRTLAQLKPHILDVDDDFLHIDSNNPNAKTWKSEVNTRYEEVNILEMGQEAALAKAKKLKGQLVHKDGRWVIVTMGFDPKENAIEMIKQAWGLTVSTKALKNIMSEYNTNIEVIPNSIDFETWPENKRHNDGIIRLGLFGSNTHYSDWKEIAEVIKRILDEFPNVHLCFNNWFTAEAEQGAMWDELEKKTPQFPDFFHNLGLIERPSQVEIYEPCQIEFWNKWLADKGVDIGLAPLKNTRFNESKSNLKYLEFSALRVPGVYADTVTYNEDIKDGHNGFLAKDYDEWYRKIKRLIEDAELRKTMGNRAWQDVKNRYDQEKTAAKLAEFIKLVKGGKRNEKVYSNRLILNN